MPLSAPPTFSPAVFSIALGSAGQVLTSNGSAANTPPTFQAVPAASPGGTNTDIQFNNAGVLAGSAKLTWDDTGQVLTMGGGAGSGGNFLKGTANANFTFTINPTSVSQLTPSFTITGAAAFADSVSRAGGSLSFNGGLGGTGSGGGNGGALNFTAGNAGTTGTGGSCFFVGGNGSSGATGSGGSMSFRGGAANGTTTASGGSFLVSQLNGGNSASTTANGGPITLTAGNGGSTATTAAGGNITLTAGTHGAASSSADGQISLITAAGTTLVNGGGILLPVFTVAALPSAATFSGYLFRVSDANAPTWNGILAGSGTTPCLAFSDGTNWRAA